MIEHVVLFKVRPNATEEQKSALLKALLGLRAMVPGILDASAGYNFSDRARGYSIGFTVRFKDRASLDAYFPHPAHKSVVKDYVNPITEEVVVVDYEAV